MNRFLGVARWPAIALMMGLAGAACAAEGEKTLFSFEWEEVEKIPPGKTGMAKLNEDGSFVFFPAEPMLCTKEKASEGKYSCKVVEKVARGFSDIYAGRLEMFRLPFYRLWDLHAGEPQANLLLGQLLNTGGWYHLVLPKDWTGYDLLRVDVCVETAEQVRHLMLEVEDNLVEPPVSVTFDAPPAGKWVTLEMDLGKAVEERKLDLSNMAHIWVRVVMKEEHLRESSRRMHQLVRDPAGAEELEKLRFRAYVDNIRLAKKGVASAYPVLEGKRSVYTAKLPRSYGVEEHMLRDEFPKPFVIPGELPPVAQSKFWVNLMQRPVVVPAKAELPAEKKPELPKGPIKQMPPSVAPIRDMIVKGCLDNNPANQNIYNSVRLSCVAAAHPEHILVGFYIFDMGSLRASRTAQVPLGRWCTAAIATVDGKMWKGLDGSDWPTVMGGHISKVPPRQVDLGGNIGGVWQFGCGALGGVGACDYPVDMMFFVRSVLTEKGYVESSLSA